MIRPRARILIFFSVFLLIAAAGTVYASGPGVGGRRVRLDDAAAGPYLVRAVTSPTPPMINNLYIEVRVTDPVSGMVLTDVDVEVAAIHIDGTGQPVDSTATHDIAPIPTEYAAHLSVDSTGVWEITIIIDGEAGPGEVSFLERVQNPPDLGWLIAIGAPVSALLLLALIFLWLQNAQNESTAG